MHPWLVSFTCCLHLFTQKRTYPVESSVSTLQLLTLDSRCCIPLHNCLYLKLLTLDSSLDLIWAAQQHFVHFQQVLAWTYKTYPTMKLFLAELFWYPPVGIECLCTLVVLMDALFSDYFISFLSWIITWFVAGVFLCFSLFALFV